MNSPHPRRGDGAVASAGHAPAPGPAAAGPGAISQATPPRPAGVPSDGPAAFVPPYAAGPLNPQPDIPHGLDCPGWPHCWSPVGYLLDVLDEYTAVSAEHPDLAEILGEVITGIRAELAQREVRS